jgi:hypothetical protein
MLQPGTRVRLDTPDNGRLHGAAATVETVTEYGAIVRTSAAASGQYRAAWSEMLVPVAAPVAATLPQPPAQVLGYSGDSCDMCGSLEMVRAGPCLVCRCCGSTSNGCS